MTPRSRTTPNPTRRKTMPAKSDASRWGSAAKFFHWTTVIAILVQATIGLIMVELPKRPSTIPVYTFHKSLGLTIFAFAILRLSWRAFDPHPAYPATMPRWQVVGARAAHALLYTLIFLVPLSGWLFDSATALRPLYWFGLFHVPSLTGGRDDAIKELAETAHLATLSRYLLAQGRRRNRLRRFEMYRLLISVALLLPLAAFARDWQV